MRTLAQKALIDMQMPANLVGFRYILETLNFLSETQSSVSKAIEKTAEQNNVTSNTVLRGIDKAFKDTRLLGNQKMVDYWLSGASTLANTLYTFYYRLDLSMKLGGNN